MPHLALVLPPDAAATGAGEADADEALDIAGRWPGRVSVVLPLRAGSPAPPRGAAPRLEAAGVDVLAGDPSELVDSERADVVRVPLDPRLAGAGKGVPSVAVAATTAVQRMRYRRASSGPHLAAAAVLAARDLWTARAVLDEADGLQCDSWGPWATYHEQAQRRHRVPPLLVFTSRATVADLHRGRARLRRSREPGAPLRIGFVGRLHPADGPRYALDASRRLARSGLPHELVVVGSGPLEHRMREAAGPGARFLGTDCPRPVGLDVLDAHLDLALLPYLHAHPTGVELDLAALGIPVVGFRSATFEGHRRFAGFTVPVRPRSAGALARAVVRLVESPERWRTTAERGVDFMSRHHTGARREAQVEHLLRVAGVVRSTL